MMGAGDGEAASASVTTVDGQAADAPAAAGDGEAASASAVAGDPAAAGDPAIAVDATTAGDATVAAPRARRGVGRVAGAIPAWAILAAAWACLLVYAWPGQMTLDSYDHLREARAGVYSDAHPPIINVTWRVIELVVSGPAGMLVVQSGLLLAGLYLILRRTFAPRPAAWWAAAVFVFPPVLTIMAVIWKDCMMAGLLVVGLAGLLSARRWARLAGLLAMLGAAAFRYNAFGATLPLVVLLFEWRPGMRWLPRYALATAAWLATTFAAFAINGALTDKQMHYWHSSLAIFDIAGTLAHVDGTLPDAELRDELAGTRFAVDHELHAAIRATYTPRDFFPLLTNPTNPGHGLWTLPIDGYEPAPPAQRDAIERAWLHVVETYPGAFIEHRLAVMAEVLDLRVTRSMGGVVPRELRYTYEAAALGLHDQASHTQLALTRMMRWISRHTPLYVPWIYLVLTLVLLPFAWRQRDVLAMLLSGLVMEASLVPLVHSRDYRYSHWMAIMTLVSCIVLGARRYRARRGEPGGAAPRPA
ncbi:MAG TPA: hypothetical protein VH165_15625 [Kofleriaceae bacterium]|nr:hypothetical protein [Kofleriaceae bacterium]